MKRRKINGNRLIQKYFFKFLFIKENSIKLKIKKKKLSSKTWKGVVKKNKFETPDDHENKIGVGTNSSLNRIVSANGTILPTTNSSVSSAAAASAATLANSAKARYTSQSYKTSLHD